MEKLDLLVVSVVLLVGFGGVMFLQFDDGDDITGDFKRMRAPRLPPRSGSGIFGASGGYQSAPQSVAVPVSAPQQQVQLPQVIPQNFFGALVNNFINSQRDRGSCVSSCGPTITGNCIGNLRFMPAGSNCDAMINPFITDCVGKCTAKFPQASSWGLTSAPQPAQPAQQLQIDPQQRLGTLVNNYINNQRERNFCLANCPVIIRGDCLANVRFMPFGTQCDAIMSPFINDCIRRCDAKFPQVQQVPVQPVPPPTTQDCADKCASGAALLYKQCMDQGAGEAACQNVGNLQKESCTKKCALGY